MNTEQLTLPPFVRTSDTSRLAAIAMYCKAGTKRAQVFGAIKSDWFVGGCTDEEGMNMIGMSGNTYRPRRVELVRYGLVMDSGQRRPTASGEQAVVWVAC